MGNFVSKKNLEDIYSSFLNHHSINKIQNLNGTYIEDQNVTFNSNAGQFQNILWQNATPTSPFDSQSIYFNWEDYEYIIFIIKNTNRSGHIESYSSHIIFPWTSEKQSIGMLKLVAANELYTRYLYFFAGGVHITSSSNIGDYSTAYSSDNQNVIPIAAIGVRPANITAEEQYIANFQKFGIAPLCVYSTRYGATVEENTISSYALTMPFYEVDTNTISNIGTGLPTDSVNMANRKWRIIRNRTAKLPNLDESKVLYREYYNYYNTSGDGKINAPNIYTGDDLLVLLTNNTTVNLNWVCSQTSIWINCDHEGSYNNKTKLCFRGSVRTPNNYPIWLGLVSAADNTLIPADGANTLNTDTKVKNECQNPTRTTTHVFLNNSGSVTYEEAYLDISNIQGEYYIVFCLDGGSSSSDKAFLRINSLYLI